MFPREPGGPGGRREAGTRRERVRERVGVGRAATRPRWLIPPPWVRLEARSSPRPPAGRFSGTILHCWLLY